MADFLDHKHCPICGRPVESETEDAYIHLFSPTRCEKDKKETPTEAKNIIFWCVKCAYLGMNYEDHGRRCIKCLRSTLENTKLEIERPIYYGQ